MGSIYKRGNKWWLSYYRNGKQLRESTGYKKESDAKHLLKIREGQIEQGVPITPRVAHIKFSELAEDVVIDYRVKRQSSIDNVERRFDKHVLPMLGHMFATGITSADLRKFIAKRQSENAAAAEINRELAAIKRAFNLGIQGGKILNKPHIPMLPENNARTGFFEREQFQTLVNKLPEKLRPLMIFYFVTGWRKNEVLSLEWRNVDFTGERVSLDGSATKNREPRAFPFTSDLRYVLQNQRDYTDSVQRQKGRIIPWVFHRDGEKISSFKGSWKKALEEGGLVGKIVHDFRRTAVRNLVRAGVPERVAMEMTGHKTRSVFERYNITSMADMVEAAKKLDAVSTISCTIADSSENLSKAE
jgi:integrase